MLLQKTLLNVEGLGRQLDPNLDLWNTAKPFLERWMNDQVGWRGLVRTLKREAPYWSATLPQLPRLIHRVLAEDRLGALSTALEVVAAQNARRNRLLALIAAATLIIAGLLVLGLFTA